MFRIQSIGILLMLYVVVPAIPGTAIVLASDVQTRILAIALAPFVATVLFAVTAGLLSIPFHASIKAGVFKRDLATPDYRRRRLYGLCWTSLYYFKPAYFVVLSVPSLKWLVFRLFGYHGDLSAVFYPDTWIRDLPLLRLGKSAYLSNNATLGTNVFTQRTASIFVAPITIGERALIGHGAIFGAGATLGDDSEVGMGSLTGMRVQIGKRSVIGSAAAIDHHSVIGDEVQIGPFAYIGRNVSIGNGVVIPAGAVIPSNAKIDQQEDYEKYRQAVNQDSQKADAMTLRNSLHALREA